MSHTRDPDPRGPEDERAALEPPHEGPVDRGEIYRNEFAMVRVTRRETETGPRLHIRDLASGAEIFLDPMELEGLTRWRHADFAPLVDPSDFTHAPEPDPDQV